MDIKNGHKDRHKTTKKTIILVVVIISALIIVSVFVIILSKILETSGRAPKVFPRARVSGAVCQPSSFDLSGGSIRVRNGCFQGLFVFVNPFDSNTLILSKAYTAFQFSNTKSIYRYVANQEEYINAGPNGILYTSTEFKYWNIFPSYGSIVSQGKKWTVIERKDKNGFLVWTLMLIDLSVQDPVSAAWIIERIS